MKQTLTQTPTLLTADKLKALVYAALEDSKAEDIETIDLSHEDYITDYMVIASGRSVRQVVTMAEKVREAAGEAGHSLVRIEGAQTGDWVVVDLGDVIVHLFRPEVRQFYNIERMWSDRSSYGHLAKPEAAVASAPLRSSL
jgi:ribosome-associated protein